MAEPETGTLVTMESIFPRFQLSPINDLTEGLAVGGFTSHDWHITRDLVVFSPANEVKEVHVVPFPTIMSVPEYVDFLARFRLRLCIQARNYLLGLMALTAADGSMPRLLRSTGIVAIEPRQRIMIPLAPGGRPPVQMVPHSLYVFQDYGRRELNLLGGGGSHSEDHAGLAERIP